MEELAWRHICELLNEPTRPFDGQPGNVGGRTEPKCGDRFVLREDQAAATNLAQLREETFRCPRADSDFGADAGAMVTYDFRTIRALQEDRSRKFREIVRMVNTGAFTVNQALTLNGLPAIAGADWYLRSANMSEVAEWTEGEREVFTTQQPDTGAVAEPDNPLEGAAMIQAAVQEAERLTIWRNGTH